MLFKYGLDKVAGFGFTVALRGRSNLVYSELWRHVVVAIEPLLNPSRMFVYSSTINHWRFGFGLRLKLNRIGPRSRKRVVKRIGRALERMSITHEFEEQL